MLVKFETRSNKVKGLSFHATRPWILTSLHNGNIQLWDYRMGIMIDMFQEHDGPVRGIDFHDTQPLFCSGGDDFKIKLWNYKLRRCLFTLVGHLDYIRGVQFHKANPYIISASDDLTLRIWNWQGRTSMYVLTGHNHYVMSACFHPTKDLVLSASLDQTLRLWDVSGFETPHLSRNQTFGGSVAQDIFGSSDVMVKYILEGHERGVNFASFHPTMQRIVSGADDKSVRTWTYDDYSVREVNNMKGGHGSNVTCAMFFKDYIVSTSEDRTIKVWDAVNGTVVRAERREYDRFWMIAVHPEKNLIAAGHCNGMIVYKLERERPAMQLVGDTLYWVLKANSSDCVLFSYDFKTKVETRLTTLNRRYKSSPTSLSVSKENDIVAVYYAHDGGVVEVYQLGNREEVKKWYMKSAVFFHRNKYACLDKGRQIIIRNTKNVVVSIIPAVENADEIWWAPHGNLLLKGSDRVYMYDPAQSKVVADMTIPKPKSVVWSPGPDYSKFAILSKHSIVVFSKKKLLCSLHENSKIKSACFDEKGQVLLYTTTNHLKYCLQNGDTGTIRTLEQPIYLVRAQGNEIAYIERGENKLNAMQIDSVEYRFKLALLAEKWNEVIKSVKTTVTTGQALVSYLQQRGYSEIAMHLVKDPKIKFKLAIDSGNLDAALECANQIDDPDCWVSLADAASKYGKVNLVSSCLNKVGAKGHQKLFFLNFLLGNDEKTRDYADMQRDDTNVRFQAALFTGDVDARIKILEEAGQYTLAHQVASSNGMTEKASALLRQAGVAIEESMGPVKADEEEDEQTEDVLEARRTQEMVAKERSYEIMNRLAETTSKTITLPEKTAIDSDWPLTVINESHIMSTLKKGIAGGAVVEEDLPGDDDEKGWGSDDSDDGLKEDGSDDEGGLGEGGGWDDLSSDDLGSVGEVLDQDCALPNEGFPATRHWIDNSRIPADHAAAGSFESAMRLLKAQYGVKNFHPLKHLFIQCFVSATASLPVSGLLPSHNMYQTRAQRTPLCGLDIQTLRDLIQQGISKVPDFKGSRAIFQQALQFSVLLIPKSEEEQKEILQLSKQATQYVSAFALQLARAGKDVVKSSEMAAHFTHYDLVPKQKCDLLHYAMKQLHKAEMYATAGAVAKRLLDYNPGAKKEQDAKQVIKKSDAGDKQPVCVKSVYLILVSNC